MKIGVGEMAKDLLPILGAGKKGNTRSNEHYESDGKTLGD
jgi:hypothetical protein